MFCTEEKEGITIRSKESWLTVMCHLTRVTGVMVKRNFRDRIIPAISIPSCVASSMDEIHSRVTKMKYRSTTITDLKDKEEIVKWVLGCKLMCIDGKQSCHSRIKGVMVPCDANITCECRRIPEQLADNKGKVHYVCTKCRSKHEKKEELEVNKGFMCVKSTTDDVIIEETTYDGKFTKEVQYHKFSEEDRNIILQRECD